MSGYKFFFCNKFCKENNNKSNFLKQLLKVILVALFHFPKFQLGTKMGSRDIGKMVTEKVSFVEWLIFKGA